MGAINHNRSNLLCNLPHENRIHFAFAIALHEEVTVGKLLICISRFKLKFLAQKKKKSNSTLAQFRKAQRESFFLIISTAMQTNINGNDNNFTQIFFFGEETNEVPLLTGRTKMSTRYSSSVQLQLQQSCIVATASRNRQRNHSHSPVRCRQLQKEMERTLNWAEFDRHTIILICATPFSHKTMRSFAIAPAGNRTRVCTVAGYYSTTRPPVP